MKTKKGLKITSKPIPKGRAARIKKSAMSPAQKAGKMYPRVTPKKSKRTY